MRCLCIGICQIVSVCDILKKSKVFTSLYEDIHCYTIFTISEDEMRDILDNLVPTCDLILSQPVSDNYRNSPLFSSKTLRERKREGARHYIISNCYFTGYDPVPFQITDEDGNIFSISGNSYYPSTSLFSLLSGDIKRACTDWCSLSAYSNEEREKNVRDSLSELKKREERVFDNNFGVDIRISDFVEENYKKLFLFHTYNHPTNILLLELTKRIMDRLGLVFDNVVLEYELLGNISIPPPLSLYIGDKMTFAYPSFIIGGSRYDTFGAMSLFSLQLSSGNKELYDKWKSTVLYGKEKITPK